MRTIDDYIDIAKARNGFKSDNQMARALLITSSTLNAWRMRRAWPCDDYMTQIAVLAGISEQEALVELNIWRDKSPRSRAVYSRLLERLTA